MLWNGVDVDCDYNGWRYFYTILGPERHLILVQANLKRNEFLVTYGASVWWKGHQEGMQLAVAHVCFGQPIQPLLDWCLENIAYRDRTAVNSEDGWCYRMLEAAIQALTETVDG